MRILFVSNMYPPYSLGGYEQLCQEVAEALAQRGHQITVLTSRHAKPEVEHHQNLVIHRALHREVEGGLLQTIERLAHSRVITENENITYVNYLVEASQPDIALIWGMWNIPWSVPHTVEKLLPARTAFYILDYWPVLPNAYIQRLEEPPRTWLGAIPKRLMARLWLPSLIREDRLSLAFSHPICVSREVRGILTDAGLPFSAASVIYLGIEPGEFRARDPQRPTGVPARLVFSGRLTPEKGVLTAVAAVEILQQKIGYRVQLDIFGRGSDEFEERLRTIIADGQLPVLMRGHQPRSELVEALPSFDIMIFPSVWLEPFAHTVLEGMASGLAVVGTTTGGTGELLIEGETGLCFPAGDAEKLAQQIARLIDDDGLRYRLANAGRETVLREFTLDQTIFQLEQFLYSLAGRLVAENR